MWFMPGDYAAYGINEVPETSGRKCILGHEEVRWDATVDGELCWYCGAKGLFSYQIFIRARALPTVPALLSETIERSGEMKKAAAAVASV